MLGYTKLWLTLYVATKPTIDHARPRPHKGRLLKSPKELANPRIGGILLNPEAILLVCGSKGLNDILAMIHGPSIRGLRTLLVLSLEKD